MYPRLSPDLCSLFSRVTQVSCTSRSVCAISTAGCAPTCRPASPTTSTGHPWHGSCRTGSWRAMPGRLSASSTRLWAHLSECLPLLDAARAGWGGCGGSLCPTILVLRFMSCPCALRGSSSMSTRAGQTLSQAELEPGQTQFSRTHPAFSKVAGNSLLPLEAHPND